MGIFQGIVAIFTSLSTLLKTVTKWFEKTPEEKAVDKIKERREKHRDRIGRIDDAIKKASKTGDTSDLERLIRRGE